jgi:hypothetical protein
MAAPTPSFKEAVDAVNSSLWDSYAPHWLVHTYNKLGSMWIWFAGKCTEEEEAHGSTLRFPSQVLRDNRRARFSVAPWCSLIYSRVALCRMLAPHAHKALYSLEEECRPRLIHPCSS